MAADQGGLTNALERVNHEDHAVAREGGREHVIGKPASKQMHLGGLGCAGELGQYVGERTGPARKEGATRSALTRAAFQPVARTTTLVSSVQLLDSKSTSAARTLAARALSVRAWRVAPVILALGPAVRTAPQPMT